MKNKIKKARFLLRALLPAIIIEVRGAARGYRQLIENGDSGKAKQNEEPHTETDIDKQGEQF